MSSARRWIFICPYYKWDEKKAMHCEDGYICFKSSAQLDAYIRRYCCSYEYEKCSMAKEIAKKYGE